MTALNIDTQVKASNEDLVDEAAFNGIAEGKTASFEEIHARYSDLLFSLIYRILGDSGDTEEVMQEVFNSLWQKAGQYYRDRGRPITWLTSMARNRAIDRLRARNRQTKLKGAYSDFISVIPSASAPLAGPEAASRRDTCRTVRSAVMELTPIQREAIEKVYFEGLTQQEIADQIGEPLGTVKARIRRGLAKLRETISEEDE